VTAKHIILRTQAGRGSPLSHCDSNTSVSETFCDALNRLTSAVVDLTPLSKVI
jgi:hypothetical protein